MKWQKEILEEKQGNLLKTKDKNLYTNLYYTEKDFVPGNTVYVNKFIFKLVECDEYTENI